MIDEDLALLKQTEAQMRQALADAHALKEALLFAEAETALLAEQEAVSKEAEALTQALAQAKARLGEESMLSHTVWEKEAALLLGKGMSHMDEVVHKMCEGMWIDGNRSDDTFSPDSA